MRFVSKKSIAKIENATTTLSKVNPVSYYFKTEQFKDGQFDENLHYGVIAQEIEKTLPNLVYTDKDGYKAVNYTDLIPLLIKSNQEQQIEIQNAKKEREALLQRIQTLEQRIKN